MKIRIIEVSDRVGQFVVEGQEAPLIGCVYELADWDDPSAKQGRTFEALVQEYWRSNAWSYPSSGYRPGMTLTEFRQQVKLKLGPGFEKIIYIDPETNLLKECAKAADLPDAIKNSPNKSKLAYGRLKSRTDWTRKELRTAIDNIVTEGEQVGVNTKKWKEIIATISGDQQGAHNER